MKVLSLFDGVSCGRVALERASIPVERYVAFEIDKYASSISHKNYPDIEHHGDVFDGDFTKYEGFDLLLGGSPCFTKGHKVLTDNGYKDVSQIKVGDMVYTHRRRYRKVIRTNTRTAYTFKVSIDGLPVFITTKEHPFRAISHIEGNRYTPEKWIAAKDLKEGDNCIEDIFRTKKNTLLFEKEAYSLGRRFGGLKVEEGTILTPFFSKHIKLFNETHQIPEFIYGIPVSAREAFIKGYLEIKAPHSDRIYNIDVEHIETALSLQRLILNTKGIRADIEINNHLVLLQFDLLHTGDIGKNRLYRNFLYSEDTGISETVYNIEVEEDQSYTVNNIIVHNCTFWSIAKSDRETTPDGIGGRLFMEYVRALRESKCRYFIYENNFSIHQNIKDFISKELGVQPVVINSSLVSAQSRKRCYWTNIYTGFLKDEGILLSQIIEDNSIPVDSVGGKSHTMVSSYYKGTDQMTEYGANKAFQRLAIPINMAEDGKSHTIPASYAKTGENPFSSFGSEAKGRQRVAVRVGTLGKGGQGQRIYSVRGKSVTISANGGGMGAKTGLYKLDLPDGDYIIRKLTPLEAERLQTLPDNYTQYGMTPLNVDIPQLIDKGLLSFIKEPNEYIISDHNVTEENTWHISLRNNEIIIRDSEKEVRLNSESKSEDLSISNILEHILKIVNSIPSRENYSEISMDVDTHKGHIRIYNLRVWNTVKVSNSQRYKCVGNGWTVDVISHLLKGISFGRTKLIAREQSLLDLFGISEK